MPKERRGIKKTPIRKPVLSEKEIDELIEALDKIPKDPEVLKEAEEFHKKVSYLSPEDLLEQFTI